MVYKSLTLWLLISQMVLLLAACGGDDDVIGFLDAPDLRLASLEVVSGGTLTSGDNPVEEFDPDLFSPYSVELNSQDLEAITLRVGAVQTEGVTLEVIEVDKGDETTPNRITEISSGADFQVTVDEGVNLVRVRVSSDEQNTFSEYTLRIERVSSSSLLQDVLVQGVGSSGSDNIVFDQEVTEDIFEYNVDVPETNCSASFVAVPVSSKAEVSINSEPVDFLESVSIPLDDGVETSVVVDLLSEDESSSSQYTFNITREASNEDEIASDARLRSLTISEGRASEPFNCSSNQNTQLVSNDVISISIVVESSRSAATMTIGDAVLDEDSRPIQSDDGSFDSENNETLVSNELFSSELLSDLQVGDNFFVITVTAQDGTTIRTYLMEITRSENNDVYVTNAEELQQALRNAEPNDFITVAKGDYLGLVSDVDSSIGSGNLSAHFFSDVSGSEDQPITVVAEEDGVRLMGDDLTQRSVLLIRGSHWRFSNIETTNAQNGVVLDGANNVLLDAVEIESVGERGLVLLNGSSNNQMRGGSVDRTGLEPQTREGITEVYGEGIVVGESETVSTSNAFRNITFGRNIANEAIDIKTNAAETHVQFNTFDSDNTIIRPFAGRSLISVAGSGAEISYNQVDYNDITSGNDDFSQLILVDTSVDSRVEIYQNRFDLDDQTVIVVNNMGMGQVPVADNQRGRGESGDVMYSGAVDESFATPTYQIQSVVDETKCFARQDVDVVEGGVTTTFDLIVADTCVADDTQVWKFEHVDDGLISIIQASTTSPAVRLQQSGGFLLPREDTGSIFDQAFSLNWLMFFDGDNARFASRSNLALFIVEDEDFVLDGSQSENIPVLVLVPSTDVSSEFSLIRQ